MITIFALSKLLFLLSSIFLCFFTILFTKCVLIFSPRIRRISVSYILHVFAKILVLFLGIKVEIKGNNRLLKEKGAFFTSNHLSYLDIIISSYLSPLAFVAKSDIKTWPIIGVFSLISNTIFVDRNSFSNIQKESKRIVKYLKGEVNILLFPEGTSTTGDRLLPFKSSFFSVPSKTGCLVIPLAAKYKKINSRYIDDKTKDLVFWYGNMEFIPHLLRFLKLRNLAVEVYVCDAIKTCSIDKGEFSSKRKYIADVSYNQIKNRLGL